MTYLLSILATVFFLSCTSLEEEPWRYEGYTSKPSSSSRALSSSSKALSSSSMGSSSSVYVSPISYGELYDSRDGKTYKTVKIGYQTWMAENLNYSANGTKGSCYYDDPGNCSIYGRLYDWATAMDTDAHFNTNTFYLVQDIHQGICPKGWHIPEHVEWTQLTNYVGNYAGSKLKSSSGWNGTNEYGFSALPGGYISFSVFSDSETLSSNEIGSYGYWWSATEYLNSSPNEAYRWLMSEAGLNVDSGPGGKGYHRFSIRCVED